MIDLGLRILKLFDFCYRNNLHCGVCWYENEFHVTINNKNGNIYSYGQALKLTDALNLCCNDLNKVGWNN